MCARAGPLLTGVAALCTDLMACSVLLDDGYMVPLRSPRAPVACTASIDGQNQVNMHPCWPLTD